MGPTDWSARVLGILCQPLIELRDPRHELVGRGAAMG